MRGRSLGFEINLSRFFNGRFSQKKAAAHVEMIVSFTLFFFFVLFLLSVLKPYDTNTLSGSVIAGINDNFEKSTYTNFTKSFIGVDLSEVPTSEKCFVVKLPSGLFAYGLTSSIVSDVDSHTGLDSYLENEDLNVKESLGGEGNVHFYEVLISPEFDESTMESCAEVTDYKLGGIVDKKVISQQALKDMVGRYSSDYEGLRSDLGVPPTYDFSITVEGLPNDFSYSMQGVPPDSSDVIVNNYIKEVLYSNGSIYNAKIGIKVW